MQPETFAWKINTTGIFDKERQAFRTKGGFDLKGVADVLGLRSSIFFAMEIKRPSTRNKTTIHQKAFIAKIKKMGGRAGVVTSLDEAKAMIEDIDGFVRTYHVTEAAEV